MSIRLRPRWRRRITIITLTSEQHVYGKEIDSVDSVDSVDFFEKLLSRKNEIDNELAKYIGDLISREKENKKPNHICKVTTNPLVSSMRTM